MMCCDKTDDDVYRLTSPTYIHLLDGLGDAKRCVNFPVLTVIIRSQLPKSGLNELSSSVHISDNTL